MNTLNKNITLLLFLIISSTVFVSAQEIKTDKIANKLLKYFKKQGKKGGNWTLKEAIVHPDYEVMGIEPSWCIPLKTYNKYHFNAFSTIVVGDYDINPITGLPRHHASLVEPFSNNKTNGGQTFIERAVELNPNVNVNIAIHFSGDYGLKRDVSQYDFLNGKTRHGDNRQTIIDTLNVRFNELNEKHGISYNRSGILIDIEDIPTNKDKSKDKVEAYFAFLDFLANGLDCNINIKIPRSFYLQSQSEAESKSQATLKSYFEKIEDKINIFVIQGYDHVPRAENPSNFKWMDSMIEVATSGLGLPIEKLVIELPNFGNSIKQKDRNKIKSVSLDDIQMATGSSETNIYNKEQTSAIFSDPRDTTDYFFDDAVTFGNKISQLKEKGIKGVALYGMGYNLKNEAQFLGELKKQEFLKKKDDIGLVLFGYGFLFVPLGMLLAIINSWEVRNALAKHSNISGWFLGIFIILMIVALLLFFVGNIFIMILGAMAVGWFVLRKMIKKVIGKINKGLKYGKYVGV